MNVNFRVIYSKFSEVRMYQICYLVCVVFLVNNLQFIKCQTCHEEEYTVNKRNVTWPYFQTSLPILSDPLCVNKNNILVTRTCINGKWSPEKPGNCVSLQVPFHPKCRSEDDEIKKTGSDTVYCLYKSEPQRWESKLPVDDVEDIHDFLDVLDLTDTTIWLPVKRAEKFGKFIWRVPSNYSRKFDLYNLEVARTYKLEYLSYDCLTCKIVTNDNGQVECVYYPANCKDKYRTVHVYNPEVRYFIKEANIIYSVKNNNAYFVGKSCRKLAQPKNEEDNFVIKSLIANRTCRMGIERDKQGAFKWHNSSNFINYTDWIPSTDFNNSLVVITNDGWYLENDNNNIECSVCEIDHTTYKTELSVEPNKNHSNLVITTYSSQKMRYIVANTIGLEDIYILAVYNNVTNEDTYLQNKLDKLDIRRVWIVDLINTEFNYYYFTALVIPNATEITTKKIFLSNNITGLEYAFELKIKKICNSSLFICDPHLSNFYIDISIFLYLESNNILSNPISKLYQIINIITFRPIQILKIDDDGDIKMLYHLRTNGTIQNIAEDYKNVEKFLKNIKLFYRNHTLSLDAGSLKSCMGCLPQLKSFNDRKIMWEFTEIGGINTPKKNCTQSEFLLTRKCGGNYLYGAEWNKPKEIYQNMDQFSAKTEELCNLNENLFNLTQTEVLKNLSRLTSRKLDLKAADIFYVSEIMRQAPDPKLPDKDKIFLAETFSLIINNMVAANISSLKEASNATNSTNVLLATAEKRLQELTENNLNPQGVKQLVHDNYMFRTADPFVSGITGVALISPSGIDNPSLRNYTLRDITANMSIEEITSWENLETAIYVPEILLEAIRNDSYHRNTTVRISISVYYNDSLFIEDNNNTTNKTQLASRVYDVTIKGYENYLFAGLPIITKVKMNSFETLCAYWDFGSPGNNITSGWATENNGTIFMNNNTIQICKFNHLTNFAMLLGKRIGYDIAPIDNSNLEIITAIGCLFSTIGICGIFLTAMVFKSWRQKVGSKVLLNVSACILLQIVLLYLNMTYDHITCVITGTLLHYSVLCGFSWSLIMAVLQYLRFVRVMGGPTSHLLLKASIVGWILPLIPVIIAVIVNYVQNNEYMPNMKELGSNLCYPQGLMLYLTLLLPVTLIVLANLVIFCLIIYNISWKPTIRNTNNDKQVRIQQLKLALLLFFLLGLTWIVGLISVMYNSKIFLYFFCATATMQGFILFLFYVVLDQSTCSLWCKMLKSKTMSSKKMSQSQQTTVPTVESNTYNSTKEVSAVSLTEVADWNTRVQAVMQQLESTHRVGSDVRSKHRVMS